jgi:hypothetical protein
MLYSYIMLYMLYIFVHVVHDMKETTLKE